jgi:hypothetical protein
MVLLEHHHVPVAMDPDVPKVHSSVFHPAWLRYLDTQWLVPVAALASPTTSR